MDVDEANFDEIVRVNTWGVIVCTQEAARQMIAQGSGGKIINTGSIASRQGFWEFVPYCVAKFGTLAVTQATARGLIEHGITVNAFAPGVVDTPMWVGLNEDIRAIHDQPADANPMHDFATNTLIGRPASPDELAPFLVYLASARVGLHDRADVHGGRRTGPCLSCRRTHRRHGGAMKGLHHVGITVKDLDASIRFYHDVLGLEFSNEPSPWFDGEELGRAVGVPGAALRQVSLLLGDTTLELLEYRSPPSETDGPLGSNSRGASHVAFVVDDIEAKKAELEAKGIEFFSPVNVVDEGVLAGWRWVYFERSRRLPARARGGRVLQLEERRAGHRGVSRVAVSSARRPRVKSARDTFKQA